MSLRQQQTGTRQRDMPSWPDLGPMSLTPIVQDPLVRQ
jgi:hypothetical protein